MAITQEDIDRLERAVLLGELTVEYGDKRVTYRSIKELKEALAYARERIANSQGSAAATTQSVARFEAS
jgi:hypothetical protein